ncbi:DUF2064 domain-containing protein [Halomonas denitrificans]|nr:DUF2064 domain-containing protein [Halomonas denitrificans]
MNASSPVVAVFVKTPGRSPIKTRLARGLGTAPVESIYRASLACVAEAVDAAELARRWAVAEADCVDRTPWTDAPCIAQPSGDLGARMAGVYRALRRDHPAVLLVGADLPQLDPALLSRAVDWLTSPERHAIGPARDGGFWLYGSSARDPTAGWPGLPYSRAETAERFRAAIDAPPTSWLELPQRTDLDESADIASVVEELDALDAPTPAQQRMRECLERLARLGKDGAA